MVTVITSINAAGTYVPRVVKLSRKNMKAKLTDKATATSVAACRPSGWKQEDIFLCGLTIL